MIKTHKVLVVTLAITLPIVLLVVIVSSLLNNHYAQVRNERLQMRSANSRTIDMFNSMELYAPVSKENKKIIDGGDGFDSAYYLQVERELFVNAKASEVEPILSSNLQKQSIKIVSTEYSKRCGQAQALYKVTDNLQNEISINISSSKDTLSGNNSCPYLTIDKATFDTQDVGFIFARMYIR